MGAMSFARANRESARVGSRAIDNEQCLSSHRDVAPAALIEILLLRVSRDLIAKRMYEAVGDKRAASDSKRRIVEQSRGKSGGSPFLRGRRKRALQISIT